MKNKYFLLTIIFLFINLCFIHGSEKYKFRTLSPEGGFYFDGVKDIKQDKEGFIWIVMENNLYRFDGYEYKQYYRYFVTLDPSSDWKFNNITVTSDGNLLVCSNNGLFRYNRSKDAFDIIYDKELQIVEADNHNNIWIRKDNQWSILEEETQTLKTPLYDGKSLSYIGPILCPVNNDLYVSSNYGKIYRYNYSKGEFFLCTTLFNNERYVQEMRGYKGKIWILINGFSLYKLDLATYTIEDHIDFYKDYSKSNIKSFDIDKNGNIWIGSMEGLFVINPETKKYTHHYHSKSVPFSLPNTSVWCISQDMHENLWIGTYSGGLCYVNLDEKNPFESYIPYENQLSHAPVSAFAEDTLYLWVGTEGGGINKYNKKTKEFNYITHSEGKKGLTYNNIKSLVVDNENNLWIGTYKGGMDCYNTKTNEFKNYKNISTKNSLYSNDIRKIVLEGDKGLWIIYQQQKHVVSYFSFKEKTFEHYVFDKEDHYIFDMVRGMDNQLWLISNKKIYLMDIKTKEVTPIDTDNSLFMNFYTLCLDDSGNLWIGTIGKGLVKYNPNSEEFTIYKNILTPDISSIYSILYDNEGNLWLGTDNGLILYNIEKNTHFKYDKKDGAQGQVYYHLGAMKGIGNKLYFGGTNGFSIVNPEIISPNTYHPKVIISEFLIDLNPSEVNLNEEVILKHDQNNFGFRFSSDNYLIPEKNHFKYRLKGYDERWIEVNASNRSALYSKVPAGTYHFEILSSNNDGVWSNTPTVIKIKRKTAPWLSVPAYLFYIVLFLFIVYLIFHYYNEKKNLKMQLYLDQIEKQKKEEIHQSQLRFFTNISHDFRTPLSLIMASIEKLRQEGLKEYYYKILNSNATRLLNLVNELMDFRTVENGKMQLRLQLVDINDFIQKIASDFIDYAKQRNINYEIKNNSNISKVYIDKNILEKIIMNLLNNAFKYTKSGLITIEIYSPGEKFHSEHKTHYKVGGNQSSKSMFAIAVRDTGVGISSESIESVFDRFYKVNTTNFESHLGTGIGLALVKSFTLLHKGSINIFSERDKGTDIVVYLPTDISKYAEKDFLTYSEKESEPEKEKNIDTSVVQETNSEKLVKNSKSHKKNILLVEDNDDLRNLIADFLSEDYEIIQAEDGIIASKLLSAKRIDLMISDIMMPGKDGITLCKETKSNIEYSHIPIMLLTAKTSLESKIEGADSGADFYFEKPVDMNLLKLTLQNIFIHHQQLKEHFSRNYLSEGAELASNERDNSFLNHFVKIIEDNLNNPDLDVQFIATKLSMSRSKLYRKIKTMTDKSVVEFILEIKLRKAAVLLSQGNLSIREIMDEISIESQAYFTNAFKKEFGETPTSFASKYRK